MKVQSSAGHHDGAGGSHNVNSYRLALSRAAPIDRPWGDINSPWPSGTRHIARAFFRSSCSKALAILLISEARAPTAVATVRQSATAAPTSRIICRATGSAMPKKVRDAFDQVNRAGALVEVDIRRQDTRLDVRWGRIEIVSGRQRPAVLAEPEESVIAQMALVEAAVCSKHRSISCGDFRKIPANNPRLVFFFSMVALFFVGGIFSWCLSRQHRMGDGAEQREPGQGNAHPDKE
jgi:hypothetical protein